MKLSSKQILLPIIVLMLFSVISCNQNFLKSKKQKKEPSITHTQSNFSIKADSIYFPISFFPQYRWLGIDENHIAQFEIIENQFDTFTLEWYSNQLTALEEPVLYNDSSKYDIFRFTWLRTFNNPVAIRIFKYKNEIQLVWKRCDGAGGYEPGNLIENEKIALNLEHWNKFQKLLGETNFWDMQTNLPALGNDGAEWILEGKLDSSYHVVSRWSPTNGSFHQACNYLINMTEIKVKEIDKY